MAEWKTLQFTENKYTDAEAVAAVAAGDNYIKNDANDESTGEITAAGFKGDYAAFNTSTIELKYLTATKQAKAMYGSAGQRLYKWHSHPSGLVNWGYKARGLEASPSVPILDDVITGFGGGCWDGDSWVSACARLSAKIDGTVTTSSTPGRITIETCPSGSQALVERMSIGNDGKIDLKDNIVKDPKNHVLSALYGTKKLVEIDIGGVPYYFEVYPSKT